MSFVIAGDTHGTLDIAKVVQYYEGREAEISKDEDYLIILGDVGVCGFSASEEATTRYPPAEKRKLYYAALDAAA